MLPAPEIIGELLTPTLKCGEETLNRLKRPRPLILSAFDDLAFIVAYRVILSCDVTTLYCSFQPWRDETRDLRVFMEKPEAAKSERSRLASVEKLLKQQFRSAYA